MSDENKLIGKTYVAVTRQIPDPTDKEKFESIDIGLLINNDDVDWDKNEGSRSAKVTFTTEQEVEKKTWVPFVKKKVKEKVEKTVDATRHTKNADLYLSNVEKQDVLDTALATINDEANLPLVVEVYHNVGQYDPSDLQSALTIREYHAGIAPDLKIMGWTKSVDGKKITFTGEILPE